MSILRNALTVRDGVNLMALRSRRRCYFAERKIGIALDDPRQVGSWNQRVAAAPIAVTDAMAEAAAREAYGDATMRATRT